MKDETPTASHHPPGAGNTSPESRSLTLTRSSTTCLTLSLSVCLSGAVVAYALQKRLCLLDVQSLIDTETERDGEVASECGRVDIHLGGYDDVIRWAGLKTNQHDGAYKCFYS